MKVNLHTVAYNERDLLPHFTKFYHDRFKELTIFLYNNGSTDGTEELAKFLGCITTPYESGGEIRDDLLARFKSTIWQTAESDWSIVVDLDEWVDLDDEKLELYKNFGYFISEGYDMVGPPDTVYGVRNSMYDKMAVFKNDALAVEYFPGAHQAKITHPQGLAPFRPNLYHMRYLSKEALVERFSLLSKRLSSMNKEKGWGHQYLMEKEQLERHYDLLDKLKTTVR